MKSKLKFSASRLRASIMIMVVDLLVLMALIGTAYMATARIDSAAAQPHCSNAQGDAMFQLLINGAATSVSDQLFVARDEAKWHFTASDSTLDYDLSWDHRSAWEFYRPISIRNWMPLRPPEVLYPPYPRQAPDDSRVYEPTTGGTIYDRDNPIPLAST